MTVIRQAHTKKYTCIFNALAQDNSLSLGARGLMLYLLSLPYDWKIHVSQLQSVMKEGRKMILNYLTELKEARYIYLHKKGYSQGWEYVIFETPYTEESLKEYLRTIPSGNSSCGKQFAGEQLQSTNTNTKKNLLHKEEEDLPKDREGTFNKILNTWTKQKRCPKATERVIKAFHEQPKGSVMNIPAWMESVYQQKLESGEAEDLKEFRERFVLSKPHLFLISGNKVHYQFGSFTNVISYFGHDEFWKRFGLDMESFRRFKNSS